jgi:HD-GYP domain-containing protein (c-di-GMP phosphodiesterase class II)
LDKPPDQYSEEEQMLMQQHPLLGGRLLQKVPQATFAEIAAVEQHHEYQDGTGYPRGLKGTNTEPLKNRPRQPGQIFRMAEILTVANMFDNLMDPNLTHPPLSPTDAVEKIITMGGGQLNSHIVGNAVNVINVFPVGATVKLLVHPSEDLEQSWGVVVKANPDDPGRPQLVLLYDRRNRRYPEPISINLFDNKAIKIALK